MPNIASDVVLSFTLLLSCPTTVRLLSGKDGDKVNPSATGGEERQLMRTCNQTE